jgi:hypothetical protein
VAAEPLGKLAAQVVPVAEVATRTLLAALELLGKDFLVVAAVERAEAPILQQAEVAEQQLLEPMAFSKVCAVLVAQVRAHFQPGRPLHQLARLVTMLAVAVVVHQAHLVPQQHPVALEVVELGVRLAVQRLYLV